MALRFLLTPIQIRVLTSMLTKEQYGALTLMTITVSFAAIVLSLGHYEYLVRRLPGQSAAFQQGVLRLVWRTFGPLVAGLAVLMVAGLAIFAPAHEEMGWPQWGFCGLALVLIVFILQRIFFLLARAEWLKVRALQLLYSDTWFVAFLAVSLFIPAGLGMLVGSWALWLFLAAGLAWWWTSRDPAPPGPAPVSLGDIFRFGIPLLPLLLGEWLFRLGDRYVLLAAHGMGAVANYSLCLNISIIVYTVGASALDLFIPGFNQIRNSIASADLSELAAHGPLRSRWTTMLRYSLLLAIGGGLFLALCGPQLLGIISSAKYQDAAPILPYLTLVPLFFLVWTVLNKILMALDQTRFVGGVTLAVAVLNLALNALLVPRLGERGSALALTASLGLMTLITALKARIWLWVVPGQLMPARLLAAGVLGAAGLGAARFWLGAYAIPCVLAGGVWCAGWILALGLVRKEDWAVASPEAPPQVEEIEAC